MAHHIDCFKAKCLRRDDDVRARIEQLLAGSCTDDTRVRTICVQTSEHIRSAQEQIPTIFGRELAHRLDVRIMQPVEQP